MRIHTFNGLNERINLITSWLIILSIYSSVSMSNESSLECPLHINGGWKVRPPDECAKQGGGFTARRGADGIHGALDINAPIGTDVFALRDGKVILAMEDWGRMGHTVIIDHGDGDYSFYGHLQEISIFSGVHVTAGADRIGKVGYSGNASKCLKNFDLSPHLHLVYVRTFTTGLSADYYPLDLMKDTSAGWSEEWINHIGTIYEQRYNGKEAFASYINLFLLDDFLGESPAYDITSNSCVVRDPKIFCQPDNVNAFWLINHKAFTENIRWAKSSGLLDIEVLLKDKVCDSSKFPMAPGLSIE